MNNAIHLQGIGLVSAKPAQELKAGNRVVWNYGYINEVLEVEELSPKFVRVILKTEDGSMWHRRMAKTRLVGVTRESL